MNGYRLIADMTHLFSIFLLLFKVLLSASSNGISRKTQILLFLVSTSRYLDLVTSFISIYNTVMKVVFISALCSTVLLLFCKKYQVAYKKEDDSFPASILVAGCAVLAIFVNKYFSFMEITWTFSIYLEAVALVPQLWMSFKQKEKVDDILAIYMIMMCFYRGFYILNWIYRYKYEHFYDPVAIAAGSVETFITATALVILFVCWKRPIEGEVESRNGKSLPIYTLSVPNINDEKKTKIFGKKIFENTFSQENHYVQLLNPTTDNHQPKSLATIPVNNETKAP